MFFDNEALELAEEISKKGYTNAKGQIVKGGAAVMHQLKESKLKQQFDLSQNAGALVKQCKSNPEIGKNLLKAGGVVALGVAAWGVFSKVSEIYRKKKEASSCSDDPCDDDPCDE